MAELITATCVSTEHNTQEYYAYYSPAENFVSQGITILKSDITNKHVGQPGDHHVTSICLLNVHKWFITLKICVM
jgi:hypothetical protein